MIILRVVCSPLTHVRSRRSLSLELVDDDDSLALILRMVEQDIPDSYYLPVGPGGSQKRPLR
jgi:hypothetical protein